jgi:hypothetical protein
MRYSRLGGPFTDTHEAEAKAAELARPPSRLGTLILRLLGYRKGPKGPPAA